jgi:hypothetical protein
MYLEKCTDLVNHLKPAFDTKTGIPLGQINLATVGGCTAVASS